MKTMKEYVSTAEGVRQMWEMINEVLDNFDFSKVKVVMETLDWTWGLREDVETYEEFGCKIKWDDEGNAEGFYPEIPQLYKEARRLIEATIDDFPDGETIWRHATGGFDVKVYIATDEERADYYGEEIANVDDFTHSVSITLAFIIEESQSF